MCFLAVLDHTSTFLLPCCLATHAPSYISSTHSRLAVAASFLSSPRQCKAQQLSLSLFLQQLAPRSSCTTATPATLSSGVVHYRHNGVGRLSAGTSLHYNAHPPLSSTTALLHDQLGGSGHDQLGGGVCPPRQSRAVRPRRWLPPPRDLDGGPLLHVTLKAPPPTHDLGLVNGERRPPSLATVASSFLGYDRRRPDELQAVALTSGSRRTHLGSRVFLL
jgi:hypothetical protein